jgi:catalase
VPVQRVGKLTLNRNPDNFFAETEQVAFHVGHIVPGIDFTNDPLVQGRLFSYTDTQLIRLGGPNFHEIPINRPIAPLNNNQRDGFMRQTINRGRTAYSPNTLGGNDPAQVSSKMGGFASFMERISATKVRARNKSFLDHFSQAAMFYHSQSQVERLHIVNALRFELGKVETPSVQQRMLFFLSQIDADLARQVVEGLGATVPATISPPLNQNVAADADEAALQPKKFTGKPFISRALSASETIQRASTRKIAALVSDGFDDKSLASVKKALEAAGAELKVVATHGGTVKGVSSKAVDVDHSLLTTASVLFDGLFIPGGEQSISALLKLPKALEFVQETFKHCKPIAAHKTAIGLLSAANVGTGEMDRGLVVSKEPKALGDGLVKALASERAWEREKPVVLAKDVD